MGEVTMYRVMWVNVIKFGGHDVVEGVQVSPSGWSEPGQQPEFDEYTVVLKGSLHVESKSATLEVKAGQAVISPRGEWVRYSTPGPEGAEYIAVCVAAFDPTTVHRDP
jgi:mannose-6-phosphate isomerase-like protein (cupin superfamily)